MTTEATALNPDTVLLQMRECLRASRKQGLTTTDFAEWLGLPEPRSGATRIRIWRAFKELIERNDVGKVHGKKGRFRPVLM
jgi:hypothetical protein